MTGILKINNNEVFGSDGTFSGTIGNSAIFPGEHHFYTSGFSNGWTKYDWSSTTNDEDGIRVYRMGKVYILHFSIQKTVSVGAETYETVLNLGTHITHPTNTIYLGQSMYTNGTGSQFEFYYASNIDSNGDVNVRFYNGNGSDGLIFTTMIGMDIA